MSREMLGRGDRATLLEAAHEERAQTRNTRRILAERSRVDHRIVRVVVDVDDRREVDLNADGARLRADRASDVVRVLVTTSGSDRHVAGEDGRAASIHEIVRKDAALEPA